MSINNQKNEIIWEVSLKVGWTKTSNFKELSTCREFLIRALKVNNPQLHVVHKNLIEWPTKIQCDGRWWHCTKSTNHWSNMSSCRDFVEKILEPYILKHIEDLGIRIETPTTWLTNHWSLHTSIDFPYMLAGKTSLGQVPFGANKLYLIIIQLILYLNAHSNIF